MVPKAMRERLQLLGGGAVDIFERDGSIEIVPVATEVEVVGGPGGPVAVAPTSVPPLTDDEVFAAIDQARR